MVIMIIIMITTMINNYRRQFLFPFMKKVINNTAKKEYFVVAERYKYYRFANNDFTFYVNLPPCSFFDI